MNLISLFEINYDWGMYNFMDYKLRNVLNSKHQMLLEILKVLSEEERWVSVVELSEMLSMSVRTVQRYINELEDIIMQYNTEKKHNFTLEIQKNLGIRLSIENDVNYLLLKNYIYEKDDTIQVLIDLLFLKNSSKKEYAKNKQLSDSSLNNSLSKLKVFFEDFDLSVNTSTLAVTGEESQIRIVTYSIAWVLFESELWPDVFSRVSYDTIEKDVQYMIDHLNLLINPIKKKEISYLLAIAMIRYHNGFEVTCREEWVNYFPTSIALALPQTVEALFHKHHVSSHEEIKYFSVNMLTRSCIYEPFPLKDQLLKFIQKDTIVYNATTFFLNEFNENVKQIPLEIYEEVFIFAFRTHLFAHMYHNVDFDYNANYLLDSISQKFPKYDAEMTIFLNHLFEETGYELFLEKEYLIQRYFVMESFVDPDIMLGHPIKILLETDLPEIYENTIKMTLYDRFKYTAKLIFLNRNFLQEPDLVVSTLPAQNEKHMSVQITYPLTSRDFSDIEQTLEKIKAQ